MNNGQKWRLRFSLRIENLTAHRRVSLDLGFAEFARLREMIEAEERTVLREYDGAIA